MTRSRAMADDSMIDKSERPFENGQGGENPDDMEEDDNEAEYDFETLNLQLDELNSALDMLEQKNAHIHAQLIELLQSNRETRQQFQETLDYEESSGP